MQRPGNAAQRGRDDRTSLRAGRVAWEGGWILLSQIASVSGALALVRVLTEYLAPASYGELALGLTVAALVNQAVFGGLTNGFARFYSIAAEKSDLGGYLRATRRLLAYGTSAVLAGGVLLVLGLLASHRTHWINLAIAVVIFSLFSSYNSALIGIQNAARQRWIVAFHSGLDAWLKIGLAVIAMHVIGVTSTAVVIGYACSSLVVTSSQLLFLRRTIPPSKPSETSEVKAWTKQTWAYSLPFSIWGVFTWMQGASDRWSLQAYGTAAAVGQYAVLYQLGYAPIALVTSLATAVFGPILYQRSGDATNHSRNSDVHKLCWRTAQLSLACTLVGVVIAWSMHGLLFRLLVATKYRETSYLLPWMILAGGLFAASQVFGLKLMSEIRSTEMLTAKIVTALLGTGLCVAGARLAGINGVVSALVIFSATILLWLALLARRVTTQRVEELQPVTDALPVVPQNLN